MIGFLLVFYFLTIYLVTLFSMSLDGGGNALVGVAAAFDLGFLALMLHLHFQETDSQ